MWQPHQCLYNYSSWLFSYVTAKRYRSGGYWFWKKTGRPRFVNFKARIVCDMVCVLVKCINLLWLKIILLLSSVPRTTPAPCPKTPSGKCFYTYFSKPQSNNLEKERNSFLLSKEKHSKFEIQSEIFRKDKTNLLISMSGKIHVLRF